jgi:hypothetical protein
MTGLTTLKGASSCDRNTFIPSTPKQLIFKKPFTTSTSTTLTTSDCPPYYDQYNVSSSTTWSYLSWLNAILNRALALMQRRS